MNVMVPPGASAGSQMTVGTPDGRTIAATVPPGCSPGSVFQVVIRSPPVAGMQWCNACLREGLRRCPLIEFRKVVEVMLESTATAQVRPPDSFAQPASRQFARSVPDCRICLASGAAALLTSD